MGKIVLFLDQELIPFTAPLVLLVGAQRSIVSNQIAMKLGRIVLQVNVHR